MVMNYNFKFKTVFYLEKIGDEEILVPSVPEEFCFKNGVYLWIYLNKVIKVGIFGEGVSSNSKSRYSNYKTVGKHLRKYIDKTNKSNGSVKPLQTLCEKIKVGDKVEVQFIELPKEVKYVNGLPYRLDLYTLEEYFKNQHKENLWLN